MWTPARRTPFMAQWAPVSQPQTILVPAPMYHTNGFNTLNYLLGGDQLVVLEKFDAALVLDIDRAASHHDLHRDADDARTHRRRPRRRGP